MVRAKQATAGGLDGWGRREFEIHQGARLDVLAAILLLAETDGVWTEAPPDARVVLIPKNERGMHHFGPEASCVLPVVHRLWASVLGLVIFRIGFSLGYLTLRSVLEAVAVLWVLNILRPWTLKKYCLVQLMSTPTILLWTGILGLVFFFLMCPPQ